MKIKLALLFLTVIIFFVSSEVFAQFEYSVRRSIADKSDISKPAQFSLNLSETVESILVDIGISGTIDLGQTYLLFFKELTITPEYHRNTNVDNKQHIFMGSLSTLGHPDLGWGFSLKNQLVVSFKKDFENESESFLFDLNTLPVWKAIAALYFPKNWTRLQFMFAPTLGIYYEDRVNSETSFNGSIARTYQKIDLGIYPGSKMWNKSVELTIQSIWWQSIYDDNFLTPNTDTNPHLLDFAINIYPLKNSKSVGFGINYINGTNPMTNQFDQKYLEFALQFKL